MQITYFEQYRDRAVVICIIYIKIRTQEEKTRKEWQYKNNKANDAGRKVEIGHMKIRAVYIHE